MEPYLFSQTGDRPIRRPRLPAWAGAFVVLVCVAMLALSAWHELDTRGATLHRSETEMADLVGPLGTNGILLARRVDNGLRRPR